MNIYFRACVQSVYHQHAHMISVTPVVNRSVDNVLVKVKPSLNRALSQVIDVMNLRFTHALLYNTISKFKA